MKLFIFDIVLAIVLFVVFFSLFALADSLPQCEAPKPKPRVVRRAVATVSGPTQKQEEDQEQNQSQTVNVYSGSTASNTVTHVIEKSVYVHRSNNHLSLLLGVGPKYNCCSKRRNYLVGGVGYERRISGPFWLGVEVFSNESYFGKIGIDF